MSKQKVVKAALAVVVVLAASAVVFFMGLEVYLSSIEGTGGMYSLVRVVGLAAMATAWLLAFVGVVKVWRISSGNQK